MAFETFFLVGSVVLLAAVTWSMRSGDFGQLGAMWPSAALTGVCGALFLFHLLRLVRGFSGWPEGQLLMATITVGSLSAATILMGLRTYKIRREGRSVVAPGPS